MKLGQAFTNKSAATDNSVPPTLKPFGYKSWPIIWELDAILA